MTQPQPTPHPIASMPVFKYLAQYIQAAASGDRATLFHLFVAVFVMARAAVRCLAEHYNAHPRQRTLDTYARLKYCFARIPAILYTLQHAPERFLTPAQLRALTRARAVLAHICNQPVDFSPLTPYLTSPENCPPPPRAQSSAGILPVSSSPSACPSALPVSPDSSLPTSHSALRASSADPLLLRNPGCALVSVLLQLAAIYGVANSPVPAPRPSTPSPSCAPSSAPHDLDESILPNPASNTDILQSEIRNPQSAIVNPQSLTHPPP